MFNINYEEEVDDKNSRQFAFSKDITIINKQNNQKNLEIKNKRRKILIIFYIIISLIILFLLISILFACLQEKTKKETSEWKGGFILLKFKKPDSINENVTLFNNEKVNISRENYFIHYKTEKGNLRNLDNNDNIIIIDNKFFIKNNDTNKDEFEFKIFLKSRISTMEEMFKNNNYLLKVDLSSLISDEINNLHSIFCNCTNLIDVNFTNFNSSKVSSMDNIFENCKSLTILDLSSFKADNLVSMSYIFKNCSNLTDLIWNNLILKENVNITGAFDNSNENIFSNFNNKTLEIIKKNYIIIEKQTNFQETIKFTTIPIEISTEIIKSTIPIINITIPLISNTSIMSSISEKGATTPTTIIKTTNLTTFSSIHINPISNSINSTKNLIIPTTNPIIPTINNIIPIEPKTEGIIEVKPIYFNPSNLIKI